MGPLTRSEQLASPPGERAIAYLASHRLGFGVDEQRALPWWATRLFVDREFAMSAKTAGYSVNHHKLGPGDLWHTKGLQLPAYIQNIAAALERDGHSRSSAISIAVGTCRRWASGGGKVSPEVRAAAAKALTEWEAAKAKAHATSHSSENPMSASLALALFDPAKHPRGPKGASNGGKFAAGPARNASAAAAQKDKGAAANADAAVGATDADAKLKALSDADLQALSRYAYSFKSADPKVVALRIKIANQLKSRGMDVNNYGGLGKPASGAPAARKPAKKTTKKSATPRAIHASHQPDDLALAGPHRYRHGWIRLDGLEEYDSDRMVERARATNPAANLAPKAAPTVGPGEHPAMAKLRADLAKKAAANKPKPTKPTTAHVARPKPAAPAAPPARPSPNAGATPAQYAARKKPLSKPAREALAGALANNGALPRHALHNDVHRDLVSRGYATPGRDGKLTGPGRAAAEAVRDGKKIPDISEPTAQKNARQNASMGATVSRLNDEAADALAQHWGVSRAEAVKRAKALDDAAFDRLPKNLRKAANRALELANPAVMSSDGPKVTLNADQRRGMAKTGVAMKDGSFPIPDRAHLHKAIKAIGRAHPAKRAAVRAHIRRRAKALGVPVPDAAKGAS